MKVKVKDGFFWGARKYQAGEIIDIDDKDARHFLSLKWVEKTEEPKPKKKK